MIRVVNVRGMFDPEQRAQVVYVGRASGGWPASQWENPFRSDTGFDATAAFKTWLLTRPAQMIEDALTDLWEATGHGDKALGCRCVDAVAGDGQLVVCHAQVLAELLARRFGPQRLNINEQ